MTNVNITHENDTRAHIGFDKTRLASPRLAAASGSVGSAKQETKLAKFCKEIFLFPALFLKFTLNLLFFSSFKKRASDFSWPARFVRLDINKNLLITKTFLSRNAAFEEFRRSGHPFTFPGLLAFSFRINVYGKLLVVSGQLWIWIKPAEQRTQQLLAFLWALLT